MDKTDSPVRYKEGQTEVKFSKTDPEIIKLLVERTGMSEDTIKQMMRYNMWTIAQYSDLSGMAVSTVNFHTRPQMVSGEITFKLDVAFPFRDKDKPGPRFIVRNKKSMRILENGGV